MTSAALTPTTGALVLLHRAVELLLDRRVPSCRTPEIYAAVIQFVFEEESSGATEVAPSRIADLVSVLAEITGGPVAAAQVPTIVSHALRHVRQAIAGVALSEEMRRVGVLGPISAWKYDVSREQFTCECVVFVNENPIAIRFTVTFWPMTTAAHTWDRRHLETNEGVIRIFQRYESTTERAAKHH